jgi:hypothetical protein
MRLTNSMRCSEGRDVGRTTRPIGPCNLCRSTRKLSYEHVPPRSAFNDEATPVYSFEGAMARYQGEDARYEKIEQQGSGYTTLCCEDGAGGSGCNQFLNERYVPEYRAWARGVARMWKDLPDDEEHDQSLLPLTATINVHETRPLNFIKQVVAMHLAIRSHDDAVRHRALADFVLDPEATGLPEGYRIYFACVRGSEARYISGAVGFDFERGGEVELSEVAFPPFATVLMHGDGDFPMSGVDITALADCKPGEKRDLKFVVPIGFVHVPYLAGDYRTRAMIDNHYGPKGEPPGENVAD